MRCYRCKLLKPASLFAADRSKASGRKSICKACDREKSQVYYQANREAKIARYHEKVGQLPTKICRRCNIRQVRKRKHWYCEECRVLIAKEQTRKRGPRTAQKRALDKKRYPPAHYRLRRHWQVLLDSGMHIACPYCGEQVPPDGPWDLAHQEGTDDEYLGPAHAACNRRTAGRKPESKRSREW